MLPRAEPGHFGPQPRPCFRWLHRPPADRPPPAIGVVLCNPFGYERASTHRTIRHIAEAVAATGRPALRFDYDGTGDSAGDDRDPGRLDAWLATTGAAADLLRRDTGVERVVFVGLRFGAMMATLAAGRRPDVAGLAVIAPVVSGKTWLRELKALQMMMGLAEAPAGRALEEGAQETAGFVITAETKAALTAVDLMSLAAAPAPEVLIIARDDLPAEPAWAEQLITLGARVEQQRLPGYTEMMLDPHDAVVPAAMVRAVTAWLERLTPAAGGGSTAAAAAGAASAAALVAPGIEETPVFLDDARTLFGIVSAPAGARPTRAIVLLNSGAIPRTGPNRLYVQLARRWAARNYLVLRFDQPGIGDSRPWPGDEENVVYPPGAVRGIAAALTHLREQWGATGFRTVGLCSGAYHGFKAATAGQPLDSVTMVNPLVFFWKPGMSLAYPAYQVADAAAQYRRSALRLDKWKKLFAGKVNTWAFVQIVSRRSAFLAGGWLRNLTRTVGVPLPEDLGAELEAVAGRGVALHFVFAAGDPGEDLLDVQGGWSVPKLQRDGRLDIRRIAGPNHTFTPVWSHAILIAALDEALGAP